MKCLSIKQPWASAIFELSKVIENRSWKTDYRGILLIHASGSADKEFWDSEKFLKSRGRKAFEDLHDLGQLSHSVILGYVTLARITENSRNRWATSGQYHWVFENPVKFAKPVKAKGRLQLWSPTPEQLRQIRKQM